MKKLTQKEKEKIRYRAIRNAFMDRDIAEKYKKRSDERIYKELGIKIPKTLQELKPLPKTKSSKSYYKRKLDKITYSLEIGLKPKRAKKLAKYSKSRIKATRDYVKEMRQTYSKESRKELWKNWTKEGKAKFSSNEGRRVFYNNLPPELYKLAQDINRNTQNREGKIDINAKYGFAVVYYMFIEGETEEHIRARYKVDDYDGDRYREIIKRV